MRCCACGASGHRQSGPPARCRSLAYRPPSTARSPAPRRSVNPVPIPVGWRFPRKSCRPPLCLCPLCFRCRRAGLCCRASERARLHMPMVAVPLARSAIAPSLSPAASLSVPPHTCSAGHLGLLRASRLWPVPPCAARPAASAPLATALPIACCPRCAVSVAALLDASASASDAAPAAPSASWCSLAPQTASCRQGSCRVCPCHSLSYGPPGPARRHEGSSSSGWHARPLSVEVWSRLEKK
jgi:hypothetical protein|uniref:Uncharacterized protein n=1 Tax=Zea mays TaxID=4577 RepID=A0A804RQY7_MAIZE